MSKFVLLVVAVIVLSARGVPVPQFWGFNFGLPQPPIQPFQYQYNPFHNLNDYHFNSQRLGGLTGSQGGTSMVSQFGEGLGTDFKSFSLQSQTDGDKMVGKMITNINGEKTVKDFEEKLN